MKKKICKIMGKAPYSYYCMGTFGMSRCQLDRVQVPIFLQKSKLQTFLDIRC